MNREFAFMGVPLTGQINSVPSFAFQQYPAHEILQEVIPKT